MSDPKNRSGAQIVVPSTAERVAPQDGATHDGSSPAQAAQLLGAPVNDLDAPRRLGVYSYGILRNARVRRILALLGWRLVDARWTRRLDAVAGWARRPTAAPAMARARRDGLPYVALEDGFLRSLDLGLRGAPPLSLLVDPIGVHYDASQPSALERLLEEGGWETPELLARAEAGIAALRSARLSKYNASPDRPDLAPPAGSVLVIDQTGGDASIRYGAPPDAFARMAEAALDEAAGRPVVVATHPDVAAGLKHGALPEAFLRAPGVRVIGAAVNPWTLIEPAGAVYAVTSQMGFEALLADKPVRLFGRPFYAGWGATAEEAPAPRRVRRRSVAELFAAAYLLYPIYFDPFSDRLCAFETTLSQLALQRSRNERNRPRAHCLGVTRWKRPVAEAFLGSTAAAPRFHGDAARAAAAAREEGGRVVAWAARAPEDAAAETAAAGVPLLRLEDGFLRSVGLGQDLRLPASLALDMRGMHYDPAAASDLEALIAGGAFDAAHLARAEALRRRLIAAGVTKYVLPEEGGAARVDPPGFVLVVGQVEDDAAVRAAAVEIRTNAALLAAARAARPDARLVYKPHPDVEAGYRRGAVADARALADVVAAHASAPALLDAAAEVWTISSLMGFEALMREKRVVCAGWPFYAGWGLTEDLAPPPPGLVARRARRATLTELVAAAYLLYPDYIDPVTGAPCEAEVILDRLAEADPRFGRHPSLAVRAVAWARARLARRLAATGRSLR